MNNPYQPPTQQQPWSPQMVSPSGPVEDFTSIPKVFGVLSIIFASLVLLMSLLSACGSAVVVGSNDLLTQGQPTEAAKQMVELQKTIVPMYTFMLIQSLIFVFMSAFLLVIGIGQVRYKRWARAWSMYWGGLALFVLLIIVVLSFVYIGPMYKDMMAQMAKGMPSGSMPLQTSSMFGGMMGGMMGVMYLIFYSPYPALLLLFFNKDRVKAAMNR